MTVSLICKIFFQILRKNLFIFRREYPQKFFDTCFLFFNFVIVFGYLMPNLPKDYGPFILIGSIASFGLFDITGQVSTLIADIEGEKSIEFSLALPIPSTLVFIEIALNWATSTFLLTLLLFPVGKIFLYKQFDLAQISYFKLLIMYISINLFFGFFSLWITSLMKMSNLSQLFVRIINPLFMFGAFFYPWQMAFDVSSIIGYVMLINPLTYIMEGMRGAALGQSGFLPFWICLTITWCFILFCGFHSIFKLKKRLDCV